MATLATAEHFNVIYIYMLESAYLSFSFILAKFTRCKLNDLDYIDIVIANRH